MHLARRMHYTLLTENNQPGVPMKKNIQRYKLSDGSDVWNVVINDDNGKLLVIFDCVSEDHAIRLYGILDDTTVNF